MNMVPDFNNAVLEICVVLKLLKVSKKKTTIQIKMYKPFLIGQLERDFQLLYSKISSSLQMMKSLTAVLTDL